MHRTIALHPIIVEITCEPYISTQWCENLWVHVGLSMPLQGVCSTSKKQSYPRFLQFPWYLFPDYIQKHTISKINQHHETHVVILDSSIFLFLSFSSWTWHFSHDTILFSGSWGQGRIDIGLHGMRCEYSLNLKLYMNLNQLMNRPIIESKQESGLKDYFEYNAWLENSNVS